VEAVQLLLECKADVAVKNTYDESPLDHAIDNMNSDVVTVMLKNKRYRPRFHVTCYIKSTKMNQQFCQRCLAMIAREFQQ